MKNAKTWEKIDKGKKSVFYNTVDKRGGGGVRILLECFFVIPCEQISVTLPHDTRLIYSDFCFQRTRRFGYRRQHGMSEGILYEGTGLFHQNL